MGIFSFVGGAAIWSAKNLFKYGVIALVVLMVIIPAVIESVSTLSPVPVVKAVGGVTVNADHLLYDKTLEAIADESSEPLEKIGQFLNLLPIAFLIYVNWKIIRFCVKKATDPLPDFPQQFIITLAIIWIIQVLFMALFTPVELKLETLYLFVPFKGLWLFIMNIPFFFSAYIPVLKNLADYQVMPLFDRITQFISSYQ